METKLSVERRETFIATTLILTKILFFGLYFRCPLFCPDRVLIYVVVPYFAKESEYCPLSTVP